MREHICKCVGILTGKYLRQCLGAVVTAALALFVLSGCGEIWGDDPAQYGVETTRYYTITFNDNGKTGGSAPASVKAVDSSYITLPGRGNMVRSGYTFDGWQTTSSGYINNSYASYIPAVTYRVTKSDTLYASWTYAYYDTLTDDRDGQRYKTVTIGGQTWMADNLNYKMSNISWCYGNNADSCSMYGRLYAWNAAKDACPAGWHLPSIEEWSKLDTTVGTYAGTKLKAKSGWEEYGGRSGGGTDEYGFKAPPSGKRNYNDGSFKDAGNYGYWWTASEYSDDSVHYQSISRESNIYSGRNDKRIGFSVRCLWTY